MWEDRIVIFITVPPTQVQQKSLDAIKHKTTLNTGGKTVKLLETLKHEEQHGGWVPWTFFCFIYSRLETKEDLKLEILMSADKEVLPYPKPSL